MRCLLLRLRLLRMLIETDLTLLRQRRAGLLRRRNLDRSGARADLRADSTLATTQSCADSRVFLGFQRITIGLAQHPGPYRLLGWGLHNR